MSIQHTISKSYQTGAGVVANSTKSYPANGEENASELIAPSTTNQEIDVAFNVAALQTLLISVDKALTLKTNSTGSPNDTVSMIAGQKIFWANDDGTACPLTGLQLTTPGTVTPTPSGTGGTLAANTYFYEVTALGLGGETLASAETSGQVLSGSTSSVALAWGAVTNATSYRIYRGTSTGAENHYQTSATNSFTDTGAVGTVGTPPTKNTTGSVSKMFVTNASGSDSVQLEIRSAVNV